MERLITAVQIRGDDLPDELVNLARTIWRLGPWFDAQSWCDCAGVRLRRSAQPYDGRYLPAPAPTLHLKEGLTGEPFAFTVAHELGHHLLQECRHRVSVRRRLSGRATRALRDILPASDEEERLCDEFASRLLLDSDSLWRHLRRPTLTAAGLVQLSQHHQLAAERLFVRVQREPSFLHALLILQAADTDNGHWSYLDTGCQQRRVVVDRAYGRRWDLPSDVRLVSGEWPQPSVSSDRAWWGWESATTGQKFRTRGSSAALDDGRVVMLVDLIARDLQVDGARTL